jgi:hypothetical protein
MPDRTVRIQILAAALALGVLPLAAASARAEKPAAKPKAAAAAPAVEKRSPIDPKAVELVRAMSATLAAAKQFTVHGEIVFDEVMHSGRKLQFAAAFDAAVRRPNGLAVEYLSDLGGKTLWYDGKTATLLDVLHGAWAQSEAPATTTALLQEIESKQGVQFPLADFLADDPAARLLGDVQSAFVVGPGDVNGATCTHLAFSSRALDWQVWIDPENDSLPCKIVITYRDRPAAPQYAASFSDWKFPRSISDDRFEPELPKNAHRVDFVAAPNPMEVKP